MRRKLSCVSFLRAHDAMRIVHIVTRYISIICVLHNDDHLYVPMVMREYV